MISLNNIFTRKCILTLLSCGFLSVLTAPSGIVLAGANISADVTLSEMSSPRFFDCTAEFSESGRYSTLSGLDSNQSAASVITDNDTATGIAGQAYLELMLRNTGIINRPGDELIVYEVTGTEPFKMAIWNSTDSTYTPAKLFTTAPTEEQNRCGEKVNAARIDLSDFGIANGTSIFRIWVDNIGAPGCCNGSDISGISDISDMAFFEKPEKIVEDHGKAPKIPYFSNFIPTK